MTLFLWGMLAGVLLMFTARIADRKQEALLDKYVKHGMVGSPSQLRYVEPTKDISQFKEKYFGE